MNFMKQIPKQLNYGNLMDIKKTALSYDNIVFLACNDLLQWFEEYDLMGLDVKAYDYDPKFIGIIHKNFYEVKDCVFDDIDLSDADLIIHMNIEKTAPVDIPKGTDVILVGDDEQHNGDCYPVYSIDHIKKIYPVSEVYHTAIIEEKHKNKYVLYGRM